MNEPERRYLEAVNRAQEAARARYPDFDRLLTETGVYAAIQLDPLTGKWRNEKIGRRVYLTRDGRLQPDPAERAYRLALRLWARRAIDRLQA